MKRWKLSGLISTGIFAICWCLYPVRAQIVPVIRIGQPAPGIEGGIFTSIGVVASINNREELVFSTGISDSGSTTKSAIYREFQGVLSPVALTGQQVPDEMKRTFYQVWDPSINDSGDIAFCALTQGEVGGITVFLKSASFFSVIADTNMEVPGVPGRKFTYFYNVQINNRREVAFVGRYNTADGNMGPSGIFIASEDGLKSIFLDGQAVDGYTFYSPRSVSFNNSGQVLFLGNLDSDTAGLFLYDGSSLTVIAMPGQAVPGTNLVLEKLSEPRINDRREITFVNSHLVGVFPMSGAQYVTNAILQWREGQLRKLFLSGEGLPGYGNLHLSSFGALINNLGIAVFHAHSEKIYTTFLYDGKTYERKVSEGDFLRGVGSLDFTVALDFNEKGTLIYLSNIAGGGSVLFRANVADSGFFFPQVADGISADITWQTTFRLVNPSTEIASSTLSFWSQEGTPMTVGIEDAISSSYSFQIPPGGTITLSTTAKDALKSGWVRLTSDRNVAGTAMFSMTDSKGKLLSNVAVPGSVEWSSFTMLAEVRSGINTAIALANAGDTDAIVRMKLKDAAGTTLAVKTLTLAAKTQLSRFLTELYDGAALPAELDGSIDVTADRPILALTLRQQGQVFTSMPTLP